MLTYARHVSVSLECRNAAFDGGDCAAEVARILRKLADSIERDGMTTHRPPREDGRYYGLRDSDGNTCGSAHTDQ